MNIGNNIKLLRQLRSLTQEQLAKKLGVSYQAVSRWENNINAPDISLLPEISSLFGVSIDALFAENAENFDYSFPFIEDDDTIRIIQMRGKNIIKITTRISPDDPPIEITFPHNCNDRTQYFKVEVYGHIVSSSSINGDVVCHQNLECGSINGDVVCHRNMECSNINGDVASDGNIKVNEMNCQKVVCNNITECYKLQAESIECSGNITSTSIVHNITK